MKLFYCSVLLSSRGLEGWAGQDGRGQDGWARQVRNAREVDKGDKGSNGYRL